MILDARIYDNQTNEAIEFAIYNRNQFIMNEMHFPPNTILRERNTTLPTNIIFDIYSENREVTGIICINDGRYTNRGQEEMINNVYLVRCLLNNYNDDFIIAGVDTFEEIFNIMRTMKEIVDYPPNNQYNLDYVHIPENLLNKWFIPSISRYLNSNNESINLN